jgi:hypothetical protein
MKRWSDVRSGRDVWLITAATVDEWPKMRPWTSEQFGPLVATDQVIDVQGLAQRALAQGLVAVAAWGPNCGEVETQFDEAIVGDGSAVETVDNVILTTSHADESLDEALEFFLDVLFPATDHASQCTTSSLRSAMSQPESNARSRVGAGLHDYGASTENPNVQRRPFPDLPGVPSGARACLSSLSAGGVTASGPCRADVSVRSAMGVRQLAALEEVGHHY